ncbi:hypothetical protein SAMN04489712_12341 [Thermomonospora echinospora]|uniref:HTTM-like domain-containing protein n=1 Tax=Thermomonospora echinospora TaxID=1992 RepID=A0A1H6DX99_9ACTN|nr:hypothetical protein [Thermomonospora echinospora]SEG89205.1 hypothetical protein SAMN04489712_12341 [Thermomonospora echinospora]
MRALGRWWYPPVPRARIAWLRILAYGFLPFDMLLLTNSTLAHAHLPPSLYQPVLLARLVHLPAPTPGAMYALLAVTLAAAALAAAGRLPRAAGLVAALGYLWWVTISMSYGKVDHDHLALVVALFVLPTAGRARIGDREGCEASGWAARCVQIAVVAAYFLSAWAKMRIGGPGWPNGATLQWALNRRGTPPGRLLTDYPGLLRAGQWVTLVAEFASPLLLVARGRWLLLGVAFFAGFHVVTYALMTIHFLPHAIWLAAFLPLERLPWPRRAPGDREREETRDGLVAAEG